jgi:hypothetical protein
MQRFEEAAPEQQRAIDLAGPNPVRLCNLAFAQANLGRFQEALATVRAALRLDAGFDRAHLLLGTLLAADPRTRAEGIAHLERAAQTIQSAQTQLESARAAMQSRRDPD